MLDYWSLGQLFANNHDRAIRYYTHGLAKKTIANIPKEPSRINAVYCSTCDCYHIARELQTITKE